MEKKYASVVSEIKDAIEILKLNRAKMAEVSLRPSSTMWGIIIIAVPAVINWILSSLTYESGFMSSFFGKFVFGSVFIPILSVVAVIFALSFIAQNFFKGKGNHIGFFRILAYASIALWVTVIPYLLMALGIYAGDLYSLVSLAAAIWVFVVGYFALMDHHKLSQQDAAIALVIGVVAYLLIESILGRIIIGSYYRLF